MKRTNRPHHAVTFLEQVVTGLLIGLTAIPPSALCGQAAVPIQPAPATFQFTRAESAPAPAEAVRQEGEPARRPASLATDRDPLAGPPALVAGAASGVTVSQNFHIVIGQTVQDGVPEAGTGRIESAGSEDIYSFTNAPGQTVYFDSFGTSSAIYWQVVDASGSEFFNWRFNWGDPGPFALPAAGLNRIRVYGVSGEAGTYGFKLWDVPPPQSFPIAIGQEVRDGLPVAGAGRVETPGAVDLYTFTNAAGQTVFFDSSGTSSAIYWQVVDTSGHELFNWHFNWGDPGRFALPVAGTNRIRAYGVSGEVGTYGFKLWDTPRPESFEIAVGQQVTTGVPSAGAGRIESPGAEDIYTFANSPGQTICFDSFGRTGGTIFWQIFDASGEQLFNRDFAAGDAGKFTFLNAGANRIRVSGLADAVGTYGFVLVNTNSVGSITNQPPPTDRFVIAVGDTVTNGAPGAGAGNIEMPGARDIYTFQAGRGIYYFEDLGAAAPLDWALYDEIGTLVFNDRLDGNDPGRITLLRGGTYSIIVQQAGANPDWIGTYSFRLWGALPQIIVQPESIRALASAQQTFSVTARSPFTPLTYQWRFNGSDLPKATNSLLFLTNSAALLAGAYDVVVRNPNGAVTSLVATLTLDAEQFFVESVVPNVPIRTNLTGVYVRFNRPILAASFGTDDILMQSPTGALNSSSFTLAQVDSQTFRLGVPAQSQEGVYTIRIGPDIADNAGHPLTGGIFVPLYATDFEGDIGPKWNRRETLTSAVTSRFLGRFGNESATLKLKNLPPHSKLRLIWDLDVVDSWEGNGDPGPDYFGFTVGGYLHTSWEYTFRNGQGIPSPQSYPGTPAVGISNFVGTANSPDSIYKNLQFDFAHSNDELSINFFGRNLEALADESWGLDAVRVQVGLPSNGIYSARVIIDKTPPSVAGVSLAGTSAVPVQSMDLIFSEPIQPASLTAADLQLTGPRGPITLTGLQPMDAVTYRLSFPWQSVNGSYRLVAGPDVTDPAGNPMAAAFTSSFALLTPLVTLAGPRFLGENVSTNGLWHGRWDAVPPVNTAGRYRYEWSFGDGATAVGSSAPHDYLRPGIYSLVLNVFDYENPTTSITQEVAVAAGAAPIARIAGSDRTVEGAQPLLLSGLDSQDDERIWIHRWLLPTQRFPFNGRFLDPNQWVAANTVQNEKLVVTGQTAWGPAWFNSVNLRVLRAGAIEGRVDTTTGASHAMVGLRDLSAPSGAFGSWVYALYFADGSVQVYEKGASRGTFTNYTRGASYDFRIETKPGLGATYFLRPSGGGLPYRKLFDSSNQADPAFVVGATVHTGVFGFDDFYDPEIRLDLRFWMKFLKRAGLGRVPINRFNTRGTLSGFC